ncbi:glycosyltransferase family A protein [Cellulomonas sp. RIT-PI-Y]|uniref:glycosyltransferase family 2 protein n=1 Tax=Cellulomonas sp. RIT-PI-Y TaxID=3035297 RepID=UPI0021DA3DDB|nr:glycosyltransferase family A protein [Cellulomonas sp. RIT-PI-Y]
MSTPVLGGALTATATAVTGDPVLTVVVPAYNAADYLGRALDSLLGHGAVVEILVVDDGSTDGTAALARRYVDRGLVRLIRQPNGGHGAAINTGLRHATGRYLKVVDADDWLDRDAFATTLDRLATIGDVDLLVANFVYEKTGKRRKHVIRYGNVLPRDRVFTWRQTGRMRSRQYLMMHALIYRTALLREVGLRLPEHTFYVDSLYACVPLARVRSAYYLDVDLYRYYIGRPGQSVQESVMVRRLDQQLRVNGLLQDHLTRADVAHADPHLRRHLVHYFRAICVVSSIIALSAGTPEALAHRDRLWSTLRAEDPALYRQVRFSTIGMTATLPGAVGRRLSLLAYRAARGVIGFN